MDKIIFSSKDIDKTKLPIQNILGVKTFVLGAFNPALEKLPNGNLIMMVRVAEALAEPIKNGKANCIRWDKKIGYVIDSYDSKEADFSDPRQIRITKYKKTEVLALTSLSWILPVELTSDGSKIIKQYWDKIIQPQKSYQEYGVEDPRLTIIDGKYYMTTCSVSSERLCTTLYTSTNGLDYCLEGIILDHLNKDMLLFPKKFGDRYLAMTRPLGIVYFMTPYGSSYEAGPSINLAQSPDLLHWKPTENTFIRPSKNGLSVKIGGGAQPILTDKGWLILFHGVEEGGDVGIYRTFSALVDVDNPEKVIEVNDKVPVLETNPELTKVFTHDIYLNSVVFTTGIVDGDDRFIVASGELDLVCRLTHLDKKSLKII